MCVHCLSFVDPPRSAARTRPEKVDPPLVGYPLGIKRGNGKSLVFMTHRIHGGAIYGNMDPINISPLC